MGDKMQEIIFLAIGAAVIGLLFAVYLTASILRQDEGNERVRFIGNAIRQGAAAFLKREYGVLAVFVIVVVVILALFIDYDILGKVGESSDGVPSTAIAYLIGAVGSALAGYIGMSIAVRANTRHDGQGSDGTQPRPSPGLQQRRGHGADGRRHRTARRGHPVLDIQGHPNRRRIWHGRVVDSPVR